MSLLNSVLGSIGTGSRMPLPKGPDRAGSSTPPINKSDTVKPGGGSSKSISSSTQNPIPTSAKRKYEGTANSLRPGQDKLMKSTAPPDRPRSAGPLTTPSTSKPSISGRPAPSATPAKPPPKGSFLDLMNQAKEKATSGSNVGVIKHASKERLSKAERRRKEEQLRAQKRGNAGRVADNGPIKKPGQPSNAKSKGIEASGYKGTAKPGAVTTTGKDRQAKEREVPTYKGTAGLKRPPPSKIYGGSYRHGKEDRYLDTDEDDSADSFIDDDQEEEGHEGYSRRSRYRYAEDYEDEVSDMEAGYDDVELEESRAAAFAKREDEKERVIEERHKREKEARRRDFERGR